ncbi:MAG TPA: site-2 protease family protein [Candidatus Limnocylindria bacterium]|nr:site-2 protease family protein [Candidatus Limnocylindria bacterium]
MNTNIKVARLLGIPVIVNLSWVVTLAFVTSLLALRFYPEVIPPDSPYRNDHVLHWVMAISSGLIFFGSILVHELAHSAVALRQGIPVKSITLFIFGGVSQISGEAKRPLHEFVMAIVGPLTSLLLAVLFFGLWYAAGHSDRKPAAVVMEWLFLMNLVIAAFNMAPGFPMDGGRVLRAILWGATGNMIRATRLATLVGRSMGYAMMIVGAVAFFGLISFIDPWSGAWFAILGLFLESSARQSWFQAKALDILSRYAAEDIMTSDLETAEERELLRYLTSRGGQRFIFFVSDATERVVGVLTEKEVEALSPERRGTSTAGDAMVPTESVPVATPREDGATLLQRMETDAVWHMPVVAEGRVIGVVNKENLLRLLARGLFPQAPNLLGQR